MTDEDIKALRESHEELALALIGYMHAMETFADTVREVTATPYPWEAQEIERENAQAVLNRARALREKME